MYHPKLKHIESLDMVKNFILSQDNQFTDNIKLSKISLLSKQTYQI